MPHTTYESARDTWIQPDAVIQYEFKDTDVGIVVYTGISTLVILRMFTMVAPDGTSYWYTSVDKSIPLATLGIGQ